MNRFEILLDSIHSAVTANKLLQLFTAMTRILLFVGFTPPSIIKIVNRPFTVLPDSHPVGHYFNALYQTGFYYQFIGWAQLTAAILLILPRTAHIGALLFLPIIVNIAVLTSSVGFAGTWLITILMALAATYLVAWDYDRLKPILFGRRTTKTEPFKRTMITVPLLFSVGGALMGGIFWSVSIGNLTDYFRTGVILSGLGLVFGLAVAAHFRSMRVGELNKPD